MEKGVIRAIKFDRGFGFITPANGHGTDIFFHCKALNGIVFDESLIGREVEFVAGTSPRTGKPECQVVQPIGYMADVPEAGERRRDRKPARSR